MGPRKQHHPDTAGQMSSQTDNAHILHRFQNLSTEKRKRIQRATPTKKLFTVDICWARGNQFIQTECHWVYQPSSRAGPGPRALGQHKINSIFFSVTFYFLFPFFFRPFLFPSPLPFLLSHWIFIFCSVYFVLMEREEREKVALCGQGGGENLEKFGEEKKIYSK